MAAKGNVRAVQCHQAGRRFARGLERPSALSAAGFPGLRLLCGGGRVAAPWGRGKKRNPACPAHSRLLFPVVKVHPVGINSSEFMDYVTWCLGDSSGQASASLRVVFFKSKNRGMPQSAWGHQPRERKKWFKELQKAPKVWIPVSQLLSQGRESGLPGNRPAAAQSCPHPCG